MSGYNETYRYQIIKSGVEGFDKMLKVSEEGGRPINSPRTWEEDLRQKNKYFKKKRWYRKGGYDVPLFVPHTPRGELAKKRRPRTTRAEPSDLESWRKVELLWNRSN